MLRTSLLVLCAAALASCESTNPFAPYAMSRTPTDEAVEGRSTWGAPLVLPGSTVRVVPEGTQLRDVLYDPVLEVAILMIASEADGDGRFTALEPPEPFVLDLESGAPLRRLIDRQTVKRVEAALGEPRK